MADTDFHLINHGSVMTLTPVTAEANVWVEEHISEDAVWIGGSVAVEPRYIEPIVEGILEEGLTIQ